MARRVTHPPVAANVILIDYDGTIRPWGAMFGYEPPLPGVKTAMRKLRDDGYRIGIFTSRLSPTWHRAEGWDTKVATAEQTAYITDFLNQNNLPFDFITAEKVPAVCYFDDKAMRVNRQRGMLAAVRDFEAMGDNAI